VCDPCEMRAAGSITPPAAHGKMGTR
jgi:hypothetical protein